VEVGVGVRAGEGVGVRTGVGEGRGALGVGEAITARVKVGVGTIGEAGRRVSVTVSFPLTTVMALQATVASKMSSMSEMIKAQYLLRVILSSGFLSLCGPFWSASWGAG